MWPGRSVASYRSSSRSCINRAGRPSRTASLTSRALSGNCRDFNLPASTKRCAKRTRASARWRKLADMREVNLLDSYPRSKRPIREREAARAVQREVAKQFGREYFDGDRTQGYGGYRYDGRWIPVAETFRDHWGLRPGDRVLDIGCAKGFLVKDLMIVCP